MPSNVVPVITWIPFCRADSVLGGSALGAQLEAGASVAAGGVLAPDDHVLADELHRDAGGGELPHQGPRVRASTVVLGDERLW